MKVWNALNQKGLLLMDKSSFKVIEGVYIAEKKFDLIWLKNKITESNQTLGYDQFRTLLFQSFTEDQIKKILEAINSSEKLLIDFDKSKVKKVVLKDEPFLKTMNKYMNATAAEEQYTVIEETIRQQDFYNF